MMWPFTRKKRADAPDAVPPKDQRVWNEDWRVGDVAQCVNRSGNWSGRGVGPTYGERLVVTGVCEGVFPGNFLGYRLEFAEFPGCVFVCTEFRKVRPQASEIVSAAARILRVPAHKLGKDKLREPAA